MLHRLPHGLLDHGMGHRGLRGGLWRGARGDELRRQIHRSADRGADPRDELRRLAQQRFGTLECVRNVAKEVAGHCQVNGQGHHLANDGATDDTGHITVMMTHEEGPERR
jgi:hypothetical protein